VELVGYEDKEAGRSLRLQSWEVHVTDDTGKRYFAVTGKVDSNGYTRVSGEIKLTWTGELKYVRFGVRGCADDTTSFYVDDCNMKYIR